jgi:hypothetical protein
MFTLQVHAVESEKSGLKRRFLEDISVRNNAADVGDHAVPYC